MFEITVLAAFYWFISLPLWQAILFLFAFKIVSGFVGGLMIGTISAVSEAIAR
ncbi:hypothetical protein AB3G45_19755 [Shinella sp. S4-D37]|uniref:hypothetical protein n=1 Tax=Shinella sp. S4-D37 TaxID=3161999 RepID=UPI003467926D